MAACFAQKRAVVRIATSLSLVLVKSNACVCRLARNSERLGYNAAITGGIPQCYWCCGLKSETSDNTYIKPDGNDDGGHYLSISKL